VLLGRYVRNERFEHLLRKAPTVRYSGASSGWLDTFGFPSQVEDGCQCHFLHSHLHLLNSYISDAKSTRTDTIRHLIA
jgi:hypothetical protein